MTSMPAAIVAGPDPESGNTARFFSSLKSMTGRRPLPFIGPRVTRRAAAGLVLALLAAATHSLTLLAQTPNLRPGKYEDTEETSIPGRPEKMPPRTYERCFTAEDLKDWNNLFKGADNRGSCKVVDGKATGTTLMLVKECSNAAGVFTATIDVTVTSSDSYHAVVNMKQSGGRATSPMLQGSTTTATAKRIRECK